MNKKGFTVVELLATMVILGILISIAVISVNININKTKEKTEDVFIDTIRDAMSVYLSSPEKSLSFDTTPCGTMTKSTTGSVNVYKTTKKFSDVISGYHQLEQSDLVNPKDNSPCTAASSIDVMIYRDDDYVYYYQIMKRNLPIPLGIITGFNCFGTGDVNESINNFPSGFPNGCKA